MTSIWEQDTPWPLNLWIAIRGSETNESEELSLSDVLMPDSALTIFAMDVARLSGREKDILIRRYMVCMTLEEVAHVYGVTRERIRQLEAKALRKMRNSKAYKLRGTMTMQSVIEELAKEQARAILALEKLKLEEQLRKQAEEAAQESEESGKPEDPAKPVKPANPYLLPIEELDLSVRPYNCLKRANVNTIGDIMRMGADGDGLTQLLRIRNLGKGSANEIIKKLEHEFGLVLPVKEGAV